MSTWMEPCRQLKVAADVDVLVLGGGPAGFSAALCAAREGADTMLLEAGWDVGGVATTGLMSHWTGNTVGGIYEEILDRTDHACWEINETPETVHKVINHEYMKTVLLEMLEEAGVRIRLNTMACLPVMEGNRIRGVIGESKSGREVFLAKVVIDATGDGDIAARAGAEYVLGREEDHSMQPVTLMLQVSGVDLTKARYNGAFEATYPIPGGDIQSMARKYIDFPAGHALIYPSVFPNTVTLNMTNAINIDGTDADSLTKGYIQCRKQIPQILSFLREHVPGYENCYLIKTGSALGVRETRHFKGVKTITEEDIRQARVFDDWAVTRAHFNFDVHNITGAGLDETGEQKNFTQQHGYTIPYGCFVPEKVDGLLLAGRNISGTHMAHANFRAMPICANMGQAAGTAAALCSRKNCLPRELPVKELQEKLRSQGVEP